MKLLFKGALLGAALSGTLAGAAGAENLRIKFVSGEVSVNAELLDNSASRDLYARLPIEIVFEDFGNGQERIFYPSPELSLAQVERGMKPQAGDIAVYTPWKNVCLFLRDARENADLVRLGRFDTAALESLEGLVNRKVMIERGE